MRRVSAVEEKGRKTGVKLRRKEAGQEVLKSTGTFRYLWF
jgi:hypothetical protein